jgi:hypothetical protein
MKKTVFVFIICALVLTSVISVYAEDGRVTYSGDAGEFIFAPGSAYTLTDLFSDLKDVMPGDVITQKITVKNEASQNVKVKVYLRSLGAHEDSVEFLSKLALKVRKSDDNTMAYMFDAAANERAGLSDWVYLGTLYSGGEVNLDVELSVPSELGNEFQDQAGYIDWEFKIEEFPVGPDDPKPPHTGDHTNLGMYLTIMTSSLAMIIILLVWMRKDKKEEQESAR